MAYEVMPPLLGRRRPLPMHRLVFELVSSDTCLDVYLHMYLDMCLDLCLHMYLDMCLDVCLDACLDMQQSIPQPHISYGILVMAY